jgi:hypothetical protein
MEKWEYMVQMFQVHPVHGVRELPSELSAVGENGWEMLGFDYVRARGSENDEIVCIFKRRTALTGSEQHIAEPDAVGVGM